MSLSRHNEDHDITETLETLGAHDYAENKVLILDDSIDHTPDIVKRYTDKGTSFIFLLAEIEVIRSNPCDR